MQYGAAQSALPRASTAVYLDQGGAGLVASVCGVVVVVVMGVGSSAGQNHALPLPLPTNSTQLAASCTLQLHSDVTNAI